VASPTQLSQNWTIAYLAMCGLIGSASFGYLAGWAFWKASTIALSLCLSTLGLIPLFNARELFWESAEQAIIEELKTLLLQIIQELQQYIREQRYRQMEGF
jgi:hypothetical protein